MPRILTNIDLIGLGVELVKITKKYPLVTKTNLYHYIYQKRTEFCKKERKIVYTKKSHRVPPCIKNYPCKPRFNLM